MLLKCLENDVINNLDSFLTALGHLDERGHVVVGAEGMLDVAEQIVGLEDEDHLTVDEGQHVSNFLHVPDKKKHVNE